MFLTGNEKELRLFKPATFLTFHVEEEKERKKEEREKEEREKEETNEEVKEERKEELVDIVLNLWVIKKERKKEALMLLLFLVAM